MIVDGSNYFLQENYQNNNEVTITSAFMIGLGMISFNLLVSAIGDTGMKSQRVIVRCTDNIKWGKIILTKSCTIRQGEPDDFVDASDEMRWNLPAQIARPGT